MEVRLCFANKERMNSLYNSMVLGKGAVGEVHDIVEYYYVNVVLLGL